MSLIFAKLYKHITGFKELTDHKDIVDFDKSKFVYIPLANGNSTKFDIFVSKGDQVKVGSNLGVRNDGLVVPIFSSVSGVVIDIVKKTHPLGLVDHIKIENDFKYEFEQLNTIDYKMASREELVDFMMNKGIVGCGGAGFPTYVKYKNVENINKLIINAVECEPFITADYKEIDTNINYLVNGVKAMQKMADAKEVVIAIKNNKKYLIDKLSEPLKNADIKLELVPDVYPMGWERSLIRHLEKKEYDNLPSEIGVIVNNSTTAINFAKAMETGVPIVEKLVTISGDGIKNPVNLKVRVGSVVEDLLSICDPLIEENILLINGGPMMGDSMETSDFVINPYSNALTILKSKVEDAVACLRCGSCSDHCPAGLQPVRILEAYQANDLEAMKALRADKCIECGLCSYVCPSKIDVTQGVILAKHLVLGSRK